MKRTRLPADRAAGTPQTPRKWQASALALAAAALVWLPATDAHALALGRVTVLSGLGEPLRAEIDVPEITPDEAASLRLSVAPVEAFRARGMEYSQALATAQVTLQRRPDGRYFLRLQSDRAINDPFLDIILETTWSSGRIVRDFTMLFDPPAMRQQQAPMLAQAAPVQPATPAQPSAAPQAGAAPAPQAQQPRTRPAAPAPATAATRTAPAAAAATPAVPAMPAEPGRGAQVTVRAGETAGRIAAANKPPAVSLDQMLVAMLRTNPEAFIDGNINRLRAGAVLSLPSAEQATAIGPAEATQTLVAQSRDFNEFRRRLAEGVPTAQAPSGSQRQAGGRVQAQVDEKRAAASSPDKLTLSKGAVQGTPSTEDRIASNRAAQDAAGRVAELNRNLNDLRGLASAGAPLAAGAASQPTRAASGPGGPAIPVPGAAAPAAPATAAPATAAAAPASAPAAAAPAAAAPAATPATASASAAAPAATASAPSPATAASAAPTAAAGASAPEAAAAAVAPPKRPSVPPPPPPEPSLVDELMDNPLVPATIGGLLVALLGYGVWRVRQRRKATQVDSSFLESRLQPDSFFGASGGQRVDTAESTPTGSSMVYSPSQLDAAGDVDPVAEADVYLAYGRDLQAEEILKEALRTNPQRTAIHTKLLEIYAKRKDTRQFEDIATKAHQVTGGQGPDWAQVCELGQELDPANPLYQPGGAPTSSAPALAVAAAGGAAAAAAAAYDPVATVRQPAVPDAAEPRSVDLDLDFSLDDPSPSVPPSAHIDTVATHARAPSAAVPEPSLPPAAEPELPSLDMDFGQSTPAPAPAAPVASSTTALEPPELPSDDNSLNFDHDPPAPAPAAAAPAPSATAPAADPSMIEFDFNAFTLDPAAGPAPAAPAAAPAFAAADLPSLDLGPDTAVDADDPLATKLALAQEFNAIGDADGARSLAQEVIAEASGDLKSRAEKFLAEIG
jgi:pilus assembly protein FimV